MTLMTLLDFRDALQIQNFKLREQNAKRMKRIRKFFKDEEGRQALRRASLCLQVTGQVEKFMAVNLRSDTPGVVGLAKGDVRAVVEERTRYLLDELPSDPNLQRAPAATALDWCAVDMLLRLGSLEKWLAPLCLLCRKWSPSSYMKKVSPLLARV